MHRPEHAQPAPAPRRRGVPLAVALLCAAGSLQAQGVEDGAVQPRYTVVPRITATQTWTDNSGLSVPARPDQITEISPGIRISRESGRVRGFLDYALRGIAYAQDTQPDTTLQALSTAGLVEALDQWLWVDFSGSISQQSLSPFGPAVASVDYGNPNAVEVRSYRVAPYVQGRVGGVLNYTARLARSGSQSQNTDAPNVGETQSSLELVSETELKSIGWLASASRDHVDYSAGRSTEADLVSVGLSLRMTDQLQAFAKVGRESSNFTSADKQTYDTREVGLTWKPSPHTQAQASWGQRSFGETRALSLEHSTELWLLRLSTQRDATVLPGLALPIMVFPFQGPPVIGLLNTTALAVQDRHDLQLSLRGVRDTVTLAYSQSDSSRIDTITNSVDVLARSSVHQEGATLGWSHRLTPRHTLGLQAAQQLARGGPAGQESELQEINLRLDSKLARCAQASLQWHRALYRGASNAGQNALSASISLEF